MPRLEMVAPRFRDLSRQQHQQLLAGLLPITGDVDPARRRHFVVGNGLHQFGGGYERSDEPGMRRQSFGLGEIGYKLPPKPSDYLDRLRDVFAVPVDDHPASSRNLY